MKQATIDRKTLRHNGYCPLPLNGKNPDINGKEWQLKRLDSNDAEIDLWAATWPDCKNTGLLCRNTPFLDIDILDEEAAEACTLLVYERWEDIPCRIGLSPKRGHPFRAATPFHKITVPLIAPNGDTKQRIEFLADGNQFAALGIHPDTRQPYRWHGGSPLTIPQHQLPLITEAEAQKLVDTIVELLIHDYGYKRKETPKPPPGVDGNGAANWHAYFTDLINHDNDAPLAMALLATGMDDGAAVNMGRALIELYADKSDLARLQRRLDEWPGMVRSARGKLPPRPTPGQPPPPPSQPQGYVDTAAELKGMTFMPLKWIVPRYLPEGVTLLAGKPKVGKSWLMLAVALGSTMERTVLDQTCVKHNVLYCALEDTRRRIRSRIDAIIGMNDIWPDNLHFVYEMPTLDQGCIARLQELVDLKKASVVIIDTLIRIRGAKLKNEDPVQCDYRTMNALSDFAKKNSVAVIVVHHVRKQTAEDVFDTISGTLGLAAAADTLAVLTRAGEELRLVTRGRDVEPEDKIVDFDLDTGTWSVSGDYEGEADSNFSGAASSIIGVLSTAKYSMKPTDVASQTGLPTATVRGTLRRLDKAGKVKRTQYGTYELAR